jgi:hypothetical protein
VCGWAVALVALEVGGVVWAVDVVSGLGECQLTVLLCPCFWNVTYTTPSLWKMIHDGRCEWV